MQINVTTRHGHVGEVTREKIVSKVGRLPRFFERVTAIEVIVDLEHPEKPVVELNVSAEHKNDFVARVESDELMKSVDAAVQKLEQQLRKYKEKVVEHHRASPVRGQVAAPVDEGDDDEGPDAE